MSRRKIRQSIVGVSVALSWMTACSDSGQKGTEKLGPPALEIVAAQNASSERFVAGEDDEISLSCDERLTVVFGPSTISPGLLNNWVTLPKGVCTDSFPQCGYIEIRLRDDNGSVLATRFAANINAVLSLDTLDVSQIAQIEGRLIDGSTDKPYLLVDEETGEESEVSDSWKVTVRAPSDCEGMGGSGPSGSGGTETGGAGPGGAGPGGIAGALSGD